MTDVLILSLFVLAIRYNKVNPITYEQTYQHPMTNNKKQISTKKIKFHLIQELTAHDSRNVI